MFEWDENKRQQNLIKHGLDFADAYEVFGATHLVIPSRQSGEQRFLAIGTIKGRFAAIIYTMREGDCRIISIRSARQNERKQYQALFTR
jgi:uncharacterized protein